MPFCTTDGLSSGGAARAPQHMAASTSGVGESDQPGAGEQRGLTQPSPLHPPRAARHKSPSSPRAMPLQHPSLTPGLSQARISPALPAAGPARLPAPARHASPVQNAAHCVRITRGPAALRSSPSVAAQNKDLPLRIFIGAKKTPR